MAVINQERQALGLAQTRVRRYMTGNGPIPTAVTAYQNGQDGTSTPREMTTLLSLIHQNNGPLLTNNSFNFFWNTLRLGYRPGNGIFANSMLAAVGNFPLPWQNPVNPALDLVGFFGKRGGNRWPPPIGAVAPVGTYTHKPQIGTHRQRSEAARAIFGDGAGNPTDVVFVAAFIDEADPTDPIDPPLQTIIRCIGAQTARDYAAQTTNTDLTTTIPPPGCQSSGL